MGGPFLKRVSLNKLHNTLRLLNSNDNFRRIRISEGDDGTSYQEGGDTAGETFPEAYDLSTADKTEVRESAAHHTVAQELIYPASLIFAEGIKCA